MALGFPAFNLSQNLSQCLWWKASQCVWHRERGVPAICRPCPPSRPTGCAPAPGAVTLSKPLTPAPATACVDGPGHTFCPELCWQGSEPSESGSQPTVVPVRTLLERIHPGI